MFFSGKRDKLWLYRSSSEISGKDNPSGVSYIALVFYLPDKGNYLLPDYSEIDPDDRALFPLNQIFIIIITGVPGISSNLLDRLG